MSEYDLSDVAFITDPEAGRRWLAGPRPICRGRSFDGSQAWIVTGYEDAKQVLTDPRFTSRPPGDSHARGLRARGMPEDLVSLFDSMLLSMDRADHDRVRPLVTLAFSARRVRTMRPFIESLVGELLDAMDPAAENDLVAALADPLPIRVVSELIGVDEVHREQWLRWAQTFNGPVPPPADQLAPALRGMVEVTRDLIAQRRRRPTDDLISELIRTRDEDGGRLTDDELAALAILVIQAGHDSVRQLIALTVLTLLDRPDQLALIRSGRTTWSVALAEVMRHAAPVKHAFRRFATEPVEVGGVTVAPGEGVLVVLAAANRDPAEFPDPLVLDVTRTPNPHLGFSRGPHFCPGSTLAMTEVEIAMRELFGRFPKLRLAVAGDEVAPRFLLGVQRLPVLLD
nr:cytochrome P450 [Streptomyces sp. SID5468]